MQKVKTYQPRLNGGRHWRSVTIPSDLLQALHKLAEAEGISVAYLIRNALMKLVKNN